MKHLSISEQLILNIQLNDLDGIKKCLNNGANINFIDDKQYTPLAHAANMFNFEIFFFLLECGADPKQLIKHGQTVFDLFRTFFDLKEKYDQTSDDLYKDSLEFFNNKNNQERMIEINNDIYFLLKKSKLILPEITNQYKYIENSRDLNLI